MTKTGHGRMIILCVATIPAENAKHLCWVLQMCIRHGLTFDKKPLFTDQGPLLAAAKRLLQQLELLICILLCIQHLIRSTKHGTVFSTKSGDGVIRRFVQDAAATTSMSKFFESIHQMFRNLTELK